MNNVGYRVHEWGAPYYFEPSDTAMLIYDFGHVSSVRMSPIRLRNPKRR